MQHVRDKPQDKIFVYEKQKKQSSIWGKFFKFFEGTIKDNTSTDYVFYVRN